MSSDTCHNGLNVHYILNSLQNRFFTQNQSVETHKVYGDPKHLPGYWVLLPEVISDRNPDLNFYEKFKSETSLQQSLKLDFIEKPDLTGWEENMFLIFELLDADEPTDLSRMT